MILKLKNWFDKIIRKIKNPFIMYNLYTIKENPDTGEYHIFLSKLNDEGKCILKSKSICKSVENSKNAGVVVCEDEEITRLKAAKLGRVVCGTCVSSLYADI